MVDDQQITCNKLWIMVLLYKGDPATYGTTVNDFI